MAPEKELSAGDVGNASSPPPIPQLFSGGRKTRILVIDDYDDEAKGIAAALSHGMREVDAVLLSRIEVAARGDVEKRFAAASDAYNRHDIVIVDQSFFGSFGREGERMATALKRKPNPPAVIINSSTPPKLAGGPESADYTRNKANGQVHDNGGRLLTDAPKAGGRFDSLIWLVEDIERHQLRRKV